MYYRDISKNILFIFIINAYTYMCTLTNITLTIEREIPSVKYFKGDWPPLLQPRHQSQASE